MQTQNLSHLEDEALTELVSGGNKHAFDELYRRYWEKLFMYVVKVIRDKDEAEDILQEVFVSVWNRREHLTQIESISAYLFSAVRFQGLKYIQKESKKGLFINSLVNFFTDVDNCVCEQQALKEVEQVLDSTIKDLPPKMQEVFILSRKEQLSHKEIAETLNISDKTVKKQIGNALKIFRLKLEKENLISVFILLASYLSS